MKQNVWLDGAPYELELTPLADACAFQLSATEPRALASGPLEGVVSALEVEPGIYSILWDGDSFEAVVTLSGDEGVVKVGGTVVAVRLEDPREISDSATFTLAAGRQHVIAPMPGRVVDLLVQEGQAVEAGQAILVVEAMKMQNEMRAPIAGRVVAVKVQPGDAVAAGDVLAPVESEEMHNA